MPGTSEHIKEHQTRYQDQYRDGALRTDTAYAETPELSDDETSSTASRRRVRKPEAHDEFDIEDSHNERQGFLSGGLVSWRQRKTAIGCIIPVLVLLLVGFGTLLLSSSSRSLNSFLPWSSADIVKKKPALVVSSYRAQDVSWLPDVPEHWEIHRYCSDCLAGDKALIDVYGNVLPVPSLIGRAPMAFLTFLIDNYDNLPPYTLFIHGHNTSWHQPENIISLLRAFNLTALERDGYIPLECSVQTCRPAMEGIDLTGGPDRIPASPMAGASKMLPAFWKYLFNSDKIEPSERMSNPEVFVAVGGGQFAVSAEAVRNAGLPLLKRLRAPLMNDNEVQKTDMTLRYLTLETWGYPEGVENLGDMFAGAGNDHLDSFALSSLYELLWPVIFGKGPVYCPATEICQNEYLAGAIRCPDWDIFAGKTNVTCEVNETAMAKVVEMNSKFMEALG